MALARIAPSLAELALAEHGDVRLGIELVQSVLTLPLARIAFNAGAEPNDVVADAGITADPAAKKAAKALHPVPVA